MEAWLVNVGSIDTCFIDLHGVTGVYWPNFPFRESTDLIATSLVRTRCIYHGLPSSGTRCMRQAIKHAGNCGVFPESIEQDSITIVWHRYVYPARIHMLLNDIPHNGDVTNHNGDANLRWQVQYRRYWGLTRITWNTSRILNRYSWNATLAITKSDTIVVEWHALVYCCWWYIRYYSGLHKPVTQRQIWLAGCDITKTFLDILPSCPYWADNGAAPFWSYDNLCYCCDGFVGRVTFLQLHSSRCVNDHIWTSPTQCQVQIWDSHSCDAFSGGIRLMWDDVLLSKTSHQYHSWNTNIHCHRRQEGNGYRYSHFETRINQMDSFLCADFWATRRGLPHYIDQNVHPVLEQHRGYDPKLLR